MDKHKLPKDDTYHGAKESTSLSALEGGHDRASTLASMHSFQLLKLAQKGDESGLIARDKDSATILHGS